MYVLRTGFATLAAGLLLLSHPSPPPAGAADPVRASSIEWRDVSTAWSAIQQDGRPLLLFVTSEQCVYCRKMERDTYVDRNVVDEVNRSFVAATVEPASQKALIEKLGVRAFPTTVIISPQAHVLEVINGYLEPKQFRGRLAVALRRFEALDLAENAEDGDP